MVEFKSRPSNNSFFFNPGQSVCTCAFLNGAELIIDVGVNAPGVKMSKKNRKKLNEFIAEYDGFTSIKSISEKKIEFSYKDGSSKTLEF